MSNEAQSTPEKIYLAGGCFWCIDDTKKREKPIKINGLRCFVLGIISGSGKFLGKLFRAVGSRTVYKLVTGLAGVLV